MSERLRDHEDLAAVEAVGDEAGDGTSSSCGANCSAMVMPTAKASLSVSSVSTTQFWAVACIQAPTLETRAPMNQIR